MKQQTIETAIAAASQDGEFMLNAAAWTGSLTITVDDTTTVVSINEGTPSLGGEPSADGDNVAWSAPGEMWDLLLSDPPPPVYTDPFGAAVGGFGFEAGPIDHYRHAALRRFCELLRHAENGTDPAPKVLPATGRHGQHDAAVGRYIHLEIDGLDHRIYYEEAGSGIPLLCQHTAGSDGRQWRHLLEDERITSRFRVIAYDLPHHGKSLPAQGKAWWAEPYLLTTAFAMAVPTTLAASLDLDRPAFIGSSVGGMLALDLARYHADDYRAVIACEAGLKIDLESEELTTNQVVTEMLASTDPGRHAESMMWVMGPEAPESYRSETRLAYAQGAAGIFPGDLYYFAVDHDLRGEAENIDTSKCAVHMLTGEYDAPTVPLSIEAAEAIDGAELEIMSGLGHFPMSEDPERFAEYLLPILDKIAAES